MNTNLSQVIGSLRPNLVALNMAKNELLKARVALSDDIARDVAATYTKDGAAVQATELCNKVHFEVRLAALVSEIQSVTAALQRLQGDHDISLKIHQTSTASTAA